MSLQTALYPESSTAACRKEAFAIEAEAALKRVKAKVQLDRGSKKQSLMRGRIALAQQRQFQQVHLTMTVHHCALLPTLQKTLGFCDFQMHGLQQSSTLHDSSQSDFYPADAPSHVNACMQQKLPITQR